MPRTGETLVILQIRCPAGQGPKSLQDVFEFWLRKRGCTIERLSVIPIPQRPSSPPE